MGSVPIYVKGGIWSNLEDEILKAGVQKYGTHAWSKIASLLQKKNARQCQTRWNEFLDPSLNFAPFTKEEDDRLMDLAKRLPNQWRSISELLGRPAQTCIDRYNILMAVDKDDLELAASAGVQVGDINPNNESIPAMPDKEELLDEEREMLAEAQARLLNTQGKKATRKIRERMLEESKRIAFLQKRRELKQAGVDSKIKAPKKKYESQIDYNEDIVYEQKPLAGIYDTSQEDERTEKILKSFERLVEKKGLLDRKSENKTKRPLKRKQDVQSAPSVSPSGSILVDDYKKPKLELSAPADSATTRRKSKKASIQHLFASLPSPKNDFEIVLDDEEDETSDDDIEADHNAGITDAVSGELTPEPDSVPEELTEYQPQVYLESKFKTLPPPKRIETPRDEVEVEFNLIAVKAAKGERMHVPKEVATYIEQITNSISTLQIPETPHPKVKHLLKQSTVDTEKEVATLRHHIVKLQSDIDQSTLDLREEVSQLSQKLQEKVPVKIARLAHQYYNDYMNYSTDHLLIQEETARLQHDLHLAQSESTCYPDKQ